MKRQRELAQPGVFRLALFEDRDVGVGVLPQFEEVLERLLGFRRVARELETARHPQIRERIVTHAGIIARGPNWRPCDL
jgi:hypothetical protein